jgi:hypothetical protein
VLHHPQVETTTMIERLWNAPLSGAKLSKCIERLELDRR